VSSVLFWHLAVFLRFLTAYTTLSEIILDHRVISGTGTSELLARDYVSDIDQSKGDEEDRKDNRKGGKYSSHRIIVFTEQNTKIPKELI